MVSKLGLTLVECPNSYSATWVNQELNVKVNQRALVKFSIGPYQDQVWCDVMSMNCGHMILGRPWKISRRTLHDGYSNAYIVHKGKEKYKLQPSTYKSQKPITMCFFDKIPLQDQHGDKKDTGWRIKQNLGENFP